MIVIDDTLRQIYKNDILPLTDSLAYKQLHIYFPDLDLTIKNDKLQSESFELTESLCSERNLVLGACEAAQVRFVAADIVQDLTDQVCIITQIVENSHTMPLGTYTVKSATLQADRRFKEVKAIDYMKKLDVDVANWYNSITFPITLKNMRKSLCDHVNIDCLEQDLQNDNVLINKTLGADKLIGRTVMQRITELNGGFGHITRDNKFKVIYLTGLGLYPSETLYPSEDLFPSENNEFVSAGYQSIDYEEYIVEPIIGLKIAQEDGDVGATVGTTDNVYNITGNFLAYGKSASELETIANNILLVLKNKYYRPHKTTMIGLPYLEVGDAVSIITTTDAIETFVFQRTLKGIQALTDVIEATGDVKQKDTLTLRDEVVQLKGKSNILTRTVEELSNTIGDVEQGLESQISQTANSINQRVTDLDNDLQGQINTQAGQIDLKVSKNNVIASINLSPETARIAAANIQLEGITTINSKFKVLLDGSMEATDAKLTGSLYSYGSGSNAAIVNNGIVSVQSGMTSSQVTATYVSTSEVRTPKITGLSTINGYIPITSQNIGEQSVSRSNLANEAITSFESERLRHISSGRYVYVSANGNFRPEFGLMGSCGTDDGRFTNVYNSNGAITSSDERLKTEISPIIEDERFLKFAKMVVPCTYKMINGTSGRKHLGFISQRIEEAMIECGISSTDFAGFVKTPIYEKRNGNGEYDTTSSIIDYSYSLIYEEFIPLIFLWLRDIDNKLTNL